MWLAATTVDSVTFSFIHLSRARPNEWYGNQGSCAPAGSHTEDSPGMRAEQEDDLPAGLMPTVLTGVAASSKGEVPVKATHLKITHCSRVARIKQEEGHTERSPSCYEGFAWGPKISVFPNWLPWFTRGGKHCPRCQKKGGQGGSEHSCRAASSSRDKSRSAPGKGHMGNSWRACANQGQPLHPLPCWHSKPSCHCLASHLGGCQHTACLFWSFREWLSNLLKMQIRSGHSPAYNPLRTSCGLRLKCQLSCHRLKSLNSPQSQPQSSPCLASPSCQAFDFSLSFNVPGWIILTSGPLHKLLSLSGCRFSPLFQINHKSYLCPGLIQPCETQPPNAQGSQKPVGHHRCLQP